MKNNYGNARGQMLLITLLTLTIALTVGLSLIGRSVSDVTITGQSEESSRAFSAAEAGIEKALIANSGSSGSIGGVSYKTDIINIGGTSANYQLPNALAVGQAGTVWLVGHTSEGAIDIGGTAYSGNLTLCWQKANAGDPDPAMEVSIYTTNAGVYSAQRYAFETDAGRTTSSGFQLVTSGNACGTANIFYSPALTIPLSPKSLMVRLRPYYSSANLYISTDKALPQQGSEITSEGQTTAGISRKINVKRYYLEPPSLFDYVIYSTGNFSHY